MTAAASGSEASAPNVLAGRLRLLLVRLSRQLRRRDPSGLTITQTSALATIVRSGPLSIGHLAEIESLPSPAATRLADRLEEAGLVSRQANPADRRGVHLVATAKGSELLTRRIELGESWLAEQLSAVSEADRQAIEHAITVLERLTTQHGDDALVLGRVDAATDETPA